MNARYGANIKVHLDESHPKYPELAVFETNELGHPINRVTGKPILHEGKPINLSDQLERKDYNQILKRLFDEGKRVPDDRAQFAPDWAPPLK